MDRIGRGETTQNEWLKEVKFKEVQVRKKKTCLSLQTECKNIQEGRNVTCMGKNILEAHKPYPCQGGTLERRSKELMVMLIANKDAKTGHQYISLNLLRL